MTKAVERYSKKYTLSVTLPSGKVVTRKTDRVYRFVVALRSKTFPEWTDATWNARIDLAEQKALEFSRWNDIYEIQIISVPQPGDLIDEFREQVKAVRRNLEALEVQYGMIERDEYNAEWLAYLS